MSGGLRKSHTPAHETRLNIALARLLESIGFKERAERISRDKKRVDILLLENGLRIAIEGSYNSSDAERDARERVESNIADLSVAVWYDRELFPQDLSESELQERLRQAKLKIRVFVPGEDVTATLLSYLYGVTRLPPEPLHEGWLIADIPLVGQCIRQAIQYIASEADILVFQIRIGQFVDEFVSSLASVDKNSTICKKLYDIFYKLYGLSVGDYQKIKELIFAKTALAILLTTVFYESVRVKHGLRPLRDLAREKGTLLALTEAFDEILAINYATIFKVARDTLPWLPPEIERRLQDLIELASQIASKKALLRRDFAGKIYHQIVGDWAIRKGFATYFTTVPAAYLLSYLTLLTPNESWEDFGNIEKIKSLRIGDFACGSGTLLSGLYHALEYLHIKEAFRGQKDVNLEEFHRAVMENVFWGFDALRYATHIAATTLALHNPSVTLTKTNLYTVPLGINSRRRVALGSLDLYHTEAPKTLYDYFGSPKSGTFKVTPSKEEEVSIEVPREFDIIEMNPPFTRATGRGGRPEGGLFGFIPDAVVRSKVLAVFEDVRESIRRELSAMATNVGFNRSVSVVAERGLGPFGSIGQAGEGLLFLFLAYKYIKSNGRIAFVLPKNLLSGIAWFLARTLLASKFHIEYMVISFDPERGYNFSESTSLSELLLVARRVDEHKDDEKTCFVCLTKKPLTSLEAVQLAHEIIDRFMRPDEINILQRGYTSKNYVTAGSAEGIVYAVPRTLLVKNIDNWGKLAPFRDPQLTLCLLDLLEGKIKLRDVEITLPMKKLGEIAEIGIDRHQFHDSFDVVRKRTPASFPCVYGGEEEVRSKMGVEPNAYILPKNTEGEKLYEKFKSSLLLPDRIRVNTAHVISVYATKSVLSNIFYAVRLKNDQKARSLTTPGRAKSPCGNAQSQTDERKLKTLCLWLNSLWGLLMVLGSREETEGAWMSLKMSHWKLIPVLDVASLPEDKLEEFAKLFDRYKDTTFPRLPDQFPTLPNQFTDKQEERLNFDLEILKILNPNLDLDKAKRFLLDLYQRLSQALKEWIGTSNKTITKTEQQTRLANFIGQKEQVS